MRFSAVRIERIATGLLSTSRGYRGTRGPRAPQGTKHERTNGMAIRPSVERPRRYLAAKTPAEAGVVRGAWQEPGDRGHDEAARTPFTEANRSARSSVLRLPEGLLRSPKRGAELGPTSRSAGGRGPPGEITPRRDDRAR